MVRGASSSFPLLQLPNAPLKCVLQNIFLHQQVGISILSKRTKELVKSLNLEACEISVDINAFVHMQVIGSQNSILIDLCFQTQMLLRQIMPRFGMGNPSFPTVMYTPDSVRTYNIEDDGQTRFYEWKNRQGFEIKDWINHMISIFHRPKLDCLRFHSMALFDLDSLVKTINDVKKIRIESSRIYPATYIRQIVQTFPSAKELFLQIDSQQEGFHNIFCQNYDVFKLAPPVLERVPRVSLNDLLIMNSRSIKIGNSSLSQKDVNNFLKHWKNGSNPRMEHFETQFHQNRFLNMGILDGLDYQIVPFERKRAFKSPDSSNVIVEGGYDIERMDGTTATITIHQNRYHVFPGFPNFPVFTLQLYVWH